MTTVLVQIAFPVLVHVAPLWLWAEHVQYQRIVTATAAIQQAQRIQPMLRKSGKCLPELSGWDPDPKEGPGVLLTRVRDTDTRLMLECDQKSRTFQITISYPRDDFGYLEGAFAGPLTIIYERDKVSKTQVIQPNADIRGLAELLAIRK